LKLDLYKFGLPWEKLVVVNNCYDCEKFAVPRCSGSTEAGRFHIVMVGNFMWWKDQRTLIEATGLLRKEGHNVDVCLVGGRTSQAFERCASLIAEMGLQDVVRIVDNQRVDGSFLTDFDLFVFSSFADTFGIALLEAMASGLPVLVSDIPSSMELIGHGEHGLYFETGSASSCAEQIAKLIDDPDLRHRLAEKAYRRAQDFRPEKVIRDLEEVYTGLAGNLP
jgi:glycosyltransferase involved in cell wall biosynthesis